MNKGLPTCLSVLRRRERVVVRRLAACLALLLAFGFGSSAALAQGTPSEAPHTLIYVIHGDGSYLYHEDGTARRADEKALAEARLVAEHAPGTEVFIFHQRTQRRLLGLFPRSDGTFYHYRDGELKEKQRYRRDPSGSGLSREAALYHARRSEAAASRTLLYYGHEVEEGGGERYHRSHSEHAFGLDEFVTGLEQFGGREEQPFDLVILSTCNNGTPGTLHALAPHARYVLAAPGDLHLSYIDSHPLHRVATTDASIGELAQQLARRAYDRLAARTETAVRLALYDTERLGSFLEETLEAYEAIQVQMPAHRPGGLTEFVDCRDAALAELEPRTDGVEVFYRAPAFGPQSRKDTHSGWACPAPRGEGQGLASDGE